MNILIAHHSFDPRINYLEGVFARNLHKIGHNVMVITTSAPQLGDFSNWPSVDGEYGFKIIRTNKYIKYKSTIIPFDCSLKKIIKDFNPDVTFLLAAHHGFGYYLLDYIPKSSKIITGYSDLPWYRHNWFIYHLFKKKWLRKVIDRADSVWVTTPRTEETLRRAHPNFPKNKVNFIGHGIDLSIFNLDKDFNAQNMPNFSDLYQFYKNYNKVLCVVTAINSQKGLDELHRYINHFLDGNGAFGVVFAGFIEDGFSEQLRRKIKNSSHGEKYLLLPLLGSDEMKFVFQNSIVSLWTQVSIGVYQSIACGCPSLLKCDEPLEHVIIPGVNGDFYDPLVPLDKYVERLQSVRVTRMEISQTVSKFDCLIQLVDGLNKVID